MSKAHPQHTQFIKDMESAEIVVTHYKGRLCWTGPSVEADRLEDVTRYTSVPLQYDNYGRRDNNGEWVDTLIVYPCAYSNDDLDRLKEALKTDGIESIHAIAAAANAGIHIPEKELGLKPVNLKEHPIQIWWRNFRARNN